MNADFAVENHGSIFLLQPLTPEALRAGRHPCILGGTMEDEERDEQQPEVRHIESLTEWYKSGQR
jgi:hypothetical protein